ncbi:MAG: M36 family metallopeptidase [Flavobacteriales bacterium]|nr:M36 family metallopeptidase [Flavobacteriales bacterium]
MNLGFSPRGTRMRRITNLFYWNNLMHDVWQRYGFDEQSGNLPADQLQRCGFWRRPRAG